MAGYLDTRDLLDELHALEARMDDPADPLDEEESERMAALGALMDDIGDEAQYGATLIPEDEFEGYAREFAEDIGAVPDDAPWPTCHIDWKAAARSLAMDYTNVTFDGRDYLVRA